MTRAADREAALNRLCIYRERRKALHGDVLAALAAGAIPADVVRASGLSRRWVARIAALETIDADRLGDQ